MLEIQVTACPDPDYQGTWRFHKNQIYLGAPEGDVSPAGLLPSFAFMIEVLPDFMQAQPGPAVEFWLLNGKRATKPRTIKAGDEIQVGDIRLKIMAGEYREPISKKQHLEARLKALIAAESPLLSLIQVLNAKTK